MTAFYCVHNNLGHTKPDSWEEYWKLVLSPQAGTLYDVLADEEFASTEVDFERLVRFVGISKNKFKISIHELADLGLMSLELDDDPPTIVIEGVPDVPENAAPPPARKRPKTAWKTTCEFLNKWIELCEIHTGDLYPMPKPGSHDSILIGELLQTYPIETLKRVATWWFKNHGETERVEIRYFHYRIARIVSDWKSKGGSTLPARRGS